MRFIYCLISLAFLLGCIRESGDSGSKTVPFKPEADSYYSLCSILKKSGDKEELTKTAISLVYSDQPKGLETVLSAMCDLDFIKRLVKAVAYPDLKAQANMVKVLEAIASLPPEKANAAFLKLAKNEFYHKQLNLRIVLLWSSSALRQPSEDWLDIIETDQVSTGVSIMAKMRSEGAAKRIEKLLFTSKASIDRKIGWFTWSLLTVRDDPIIVGLYKSVLGKKIEDQELRNVIVQSMFDYRPNEWYPVGKLHSPLPEPPPWKKASSGVLKEVLVIAELTQKLDISENTRQGVKKTAKEIELILDLRSPAGPQKVAQLIAELGHSQFAVREMSSVKLAEYGYLIEDPLRDALEKKDVSAEARARIQELLKKLHNGI